MNTRIVWSRVLVIVGSIAMAIGAIDPIEGAFVILPGSGMVALGAYLAQTHARKLAYWAFILIAVGSTGLMILSAFGGFGSNAGGKAAPVFGSWWWGLLALPYPVGWLVGLVAITLTLTELFKGRRRLAVVGIWGLAAVGLLVWQYILIRLLLTSWPKH